MIFMSYLCGVIIKAMGTNRIDLKGERFGRLEVLSFAGKTDEGIAKWNVRCDCGCEFVAYSHNLRYGRTKSCGCSRKSGVV